MIVINPVLEVGLRRFGSPAFLIRSLLRGSEIAPLFLQPVPGSDVAEFLGIQKALVGNGGIDRAFLEGHTEGREAVLAQVEATDWATISGTCGLGRQGGHPPLPRHQAQPGPFPWSGGPEHPGAAGVRVQPLRPPHRTTVKSGINIVRLNEPGQTHLRDADLISEVAILSRLAACLLGTATVDWGRLQDPVYVQH